MDRVGNQFSEQELGVIGNVNWVLWNSGLAKVLFHVSKVFFYGNDSVFQKAKKVFRNFMVYLGKRGIRRFRHREDLIESL